MKRTTKLVSVLLAVLIALSSFAVLPAFAHSHSSQAPGSQFEFGDVNRDGAIDIMDATLVQKKAADKAVLDDEQMILGDVNGDGGVDILDATLIQKFVVDRIDKFPVEDIVPTQPVTVEPTVEPTTAEPTVEPTTEPEGEYYIIGTMNGWSINDDYKLTANEAAEGEYMFTGLKLKVSDQFKVGYSVEGKEPKVWYPNGYNNNYGQHGEITADGTYDVYFRPDGTGGEDWFYNCIFVVEQEEPSVEPTTAEPTVEPTTAEPTAAPTTAEPETAEATTEPAPAQGGYYIVGTMTGWAVDADYQLTANESAEGEYMYTGLNLTAGSDEFKVVYSEDGKEATTWYPEGMGNNYGENGEITETNVYDVYFRPDGQGGEDWFYNCIYVAAQGEPEQPTTAEPSQPETQEATTEPTPVDTITVFFTDAQNYGDVNVYYWPNGGDWPGVAMTKTEVNEYQQQVYTAEIPADTTGIVFNGNGRQTVDIKEGIADNAWWYTVEQTDDQGHNYVQLVGEPETQEATTEPETAEATTEPAPAQGGYYIVGTMTGWAVNADYQLTANEAAEGEYMFTGLNLTAGSDEFKVVYSEDGKEATTWYPEGMGNNYGENGEITETNVYDVYFRPDGQGGEDWFHNYFYVAAQGEPEQPTTVEPTQPETAEPTSEPTPVDTITVFFTDAQNYGDVNVHYWPNGGDWPGKAMTKTEINEYNQQVYKAEIPANVEGIVFNGNGKQTVDITEGIADNAWWYTVEQTDDQGHNYVKLVGEPETQEATTEPETAEATTEPAPAQGGYYIVGTMTGWAVDADYQLKANEAAEGEYMFTGLNLTAGSDQFKIGYSEDGATITTWYPEGMGNNYGENGEITETNVYDVYFRPDGQGGEDWFYNCIYVAAQGEPEQPTTAEPTGEPETAEATTEPAPAQGGYYIVGTMTGWAVDADYQLTANESAEGEYMFTGLNLTAGSDQFKVVYSEDGKEATTWYPEGMGNNYGENGEITETNVYDVYFRPDGQGGEDWFYNCIYVAAQGEPEQPTTVEPTQPETAEATTEPAPAQGGYYIVGTMTGWAVDTDYQLTANEAAEGEYMFTGLNLTAGSDEFKVVYSEDGKEATTWYPEGMGNNYGENGEITETNVYDVYFRPDGQGGEDWFYNCIYVAAQGEPEQPTTAEPTGEPETAEATTEPAPAQGGYYIVGTMTGWAVDADYQLKANEAAEGEYMFKGLNLTAGSDQFKVVYSEDGKEATTWYPEGMGNNYGENGEITETNVYDVYFRPDGQGGEDWFYNCIYVAAQGEPEQPTTAEPSQPETAEPTSEPTPVEGGYYIVGTMTGWAVDADYQLTANEAAEGEYMFTGLNLTAGSDQFKVVYSEDGKEATTWYPEGMGNNYGENGEITETNVYDVYFRPDGQGGEDWFHNYFYVAAQGEPEQPTTVEPTGEPETTEATTEPAPAQGGYYIVGTMTGWAVDADYQLTANEAAEGEYMFTGLNLTAGSDQFKVVYSEDGKEATTWYPEGMGNNYGENGEITETNVYDVYFRPDGQGGEDWFYNCIYVAAQGEPEQPTTVEPTQPETAEPTSEPTPVDTITVFFTDAQNYGDVNVYYWPNGGDWPGKAMTQTEINEYNQQVYKAEIPADVDGIIFNGNGRQTVDIKEGIADNAWWYTVEQTDEKGHNYVQLVGEPETQEATTEPETAEATTEPAPAQGGYYIVGTMTGWAVNADYQLTANESAEGEYMFTGLNLTAGSDQFKVVYSEDGKEATTWYPEGMGNNYGENGEITETNVYDVYFRPDGQGGEDWFYNCIYVAAQGEPEQPTTAEPTQPETQEATTEPETAEATTEPAPAQGGYYIVGTMTGWAVNADYQLTANEAAEGEYVFTGLNLTAGSDQFKVVYSEDGKEATTWYPEGMGNNYGENGEITETNVYDVYFRPDGQGGEDWFYNCIYVAAQGEPEQPTTAEPTQPETQEPTEATQEPTEATQEPTGEPAETITVFFTDAQNYGDVNVYYWPNGGEFPGKAMTKTEINEYNQQVYKAEIPANVEGIVFNGNGKQTVDIKEGIADNAWWYTVEQTDEKGHNYVQLVGEPETQEPTGEPETAEATTEPAPAQGGYYIVGTMTGWAVDADYQLTANEAAEGEYVFTGLNLTAGSDEFKVVYSEDGKEATTWYPEGMGNNYGENGEITETNVYDVYFRPDGQGGEDWFYNCIYVAAQGEPEQPTTAEPTQPETQEATTEPETAEATTEPAPAQGGYYIVGTMTGWAVDADYQLTSNEAAEGEYVFTGLNLTAGSDQFKVVYSEDGKEATTWYPEGMGNNYGENGEITETNVYDVYFRPDGQGGEDWFYNCIYVAAQGEPEQPTTAEPTQPETQEPTEATQEPTGEPAETITVFFTDAQNYGDVNVYYWPNGGEFPGKAMTKTEINEYNQQVYTAEIPADVEGIIFNGNGRQTVDIKEGIADNAWWYTVEQTDEKGHNYVVLVGSEPATQEPTGEPEPQGTVVKLQPSNDWKKDNARFAVYVFNKSTGKNAWADMTPVGDGTYTVTLPEGTWEKIIFCRMNPAATANNWNNKWNQSSDLKIVPDQTYVVPSGTWDGW